MPFLRASTVRSTLFCALLLACRQTQAGPVSAKHAKLELISRQDGIAPGGVALLGVHFTLEPGWHIYWINPGDSGQPPQFRWQLPQGFTAGEIQWPHPERLQSKPELADYGYHDGVLLMAPLRAPLAAPGKTVDVEVQAKWLICREICLPDRAELHLALPVKPTPAANAATARSFDAAQELVPKVPPRTWRTSVTSHRDEFVFSLKTGKRMSRAEFFPLDSGQIDNAAPQKVEPAEDGVTLRLKKSELLLKPFSELRGVVVVDGLAYRVQAKVSSQ